MDPTQQGDPSLVAASLALGQPISNPVIPPPPMPSAEDGSEDDEGADDNPFQDDSGVHDDGPGERRPGRRKITIEYIEDKSKRHITFSKRKSGIMKKAYELSTLTGTQVLLVVASETGHVYTFATRKLKPLITRPEGKNLIQACLNAPESPPQSPERDAYQAAPAPVPRQQALGGMVHPQAVPWEAADKVGDKDDLYAQQYMQHARGMPMAYPATPQMYSYMQPAHTYWPGGPKPPQGGES